MNPCGRTVAGASLPLRRLPVLDQKERLVGIISLGDLAVRGDGGIAGKVLEHVCAPAYAT